MDFDDQIELEHLLFFDRKCRVCGEVKSLLDDFYLTRKDRGTLPSAYSYECKVCTKKRVNNKKKYDKKVKFNWEYPDW
jgi:alpha-D-ribose 1-methylphosphonate 5-phosphate C-P lyase